ncbi:phage tail protein [Novosphingobium sp. FSW06-99]|uniref:phage tail protein n=1 Tax=Novosphingobium sp. FSW06-99 TaxID=1739113 RepID=UPI00076D16D2|nr:tail fiber protein [Novosphingobium sp. FSW06-99]KUR78181.1 hypothetical protein AQZ49_07555 [Novosphingobium sp. FSW06-99]
MTEPYIGEIRLWPCTRIPTGYHLCDGSLLAISNYQALFALIGTTYGGDGTTNFAVPDLRNRVPVHTGTGPGLTARPLGSTGGETQVALTVSSIPLHTHPFNATTAGATAANPGPSVTLATVGTGYTAYEPVSANPTMTALSPASIPGGGGQGLPHSNLMPTLSLNFIIAWVGVYPPRN